MSYKYTVARILMFRGYDLRQHGNGAYIDIYSVDSITISDIYQFMKFKLIKYFFIFLFKSNIYTTMVAKRGRPSKNTNTIRVDDLDVEFLSKKENVYGVDICYFKVVDVNTKTKLKQVKAVEEDEIRMPYWKTEKHELILKVKDKFINYDQELQRGNMYSINVDFESYSIDNIENPVKGYYCKVQCVKKIHFEVEIADEDSK